MVRAVPIGWRYPGHLWEWAINKCKICSKALCQIHQVANFLIRRPVPCRLRTQSGLSNLVHRVVNHPSIVFIPNWVIASEESLLVQADIILFKVILEPQLSHYKEIQVWLNPQKKCNSFITYNFKQKEEVSNTKCSRIISKDQLEATLPLVEAEVISLSAIQVEKLLIISLLHKREQWNLQRMASTK